MPRAFIVLRCVTLTAAPALAQCPGNWSRIPGEFGLTGTVYSLATWDPDGPGPQASRLVAAGSFTYAGGSPARHIAQWDGAGWSPMGQDADGIVGSLLVLGTEVFASGDLSQGPIVRWTGSGWAALPDIPVGSPVMLDSFQGRLTVGSPQGVASWDGSTWSPVGANSPLDISLVHQVGSRLFAATRNSNPQLVYDFDGSVWTQIGSFTSFKQPPQAYFSALGDFNGELLVGGYFQRLNGEWSPSFSLVRWNGTGWSALGNFPGTPASFVVDNGQLYIGGGWVWRFDSGAWTQLATTNPDFGVNAMASYGGAIVAAGDFDSLNDAAMAGIATLNGTIPTPLGTGLLGRAGAAPYPVGTLGGDLVVAGDFTSINGGPAVAAARWTGSDWIPMSAGAPTKVVFEHGVELAGLFYASGYYRSGGGYTTVVMRYDGQQWTPIATPDTTDLLAVHDGQLIATVYSPSGYLIERWDGSQWSPLGTQTIPGGVAGAASIAGTLWMAAEYTNPAIYRWQGSSWQSVATVQGQNPYTAYLRDVGQYNGELVVGGYFVSAGGVLANSIAAFNGTAWQPLANGVSGSSFLPEVQHMAAVGGLLAVSGDFWSPAPGLAFWNGQQWQAPPAAPPPISISTFSRLGQHQGRIVATASYDAGDGTRPALVMYLPPACYANCDCSSVPPLLTALDFGCFLNRFAAGDAYANCDGSTAPPVLNVLDFVCFLNHFASMQGCQ